jgi:hypothetical protein
MCMELLPSKRAAKPKNNSALPPSAAKPKNNNALLPSRRIAASKLSGKNNSGLLPSKRAAKP